MACRLPLTWKLTRGKLAKPQLDIVDAVSFSLFLSFFYYIEFFFLILFMKVYWLSLTNWRKMSIFGHLIQQITCLHHLKWLTIFVCFMIIILLFWHEGHDCNYMFLHEILNKYLTKREKRCDLGTRDAPCLLRTVRPKTLQELLPCPRIQSKFRKPY